MNNRIVNEIEYVRIVIGMIGGKELLRKATIAPDRDGFRLEFQGNNNHILWNDYTFYKPEIYVEENDYIVRFDTWADAIEFLLK